MCNVRAFAFDGAPFASSVAAFAFEVAAFAFGVGTFAFELGTFAFFAGAAAQAGARLAPVKLFDDSVLERLIDLGEHVGDLREQLSQRSKRSAQVVVAAAQSDANAVRDGRS